MLNSNGMCVRLSIGLKCIYPGTIYNTQQEISHTESQITDISMSSTNSCVINITGSALCLGQNTNGQMDESSPGWGHFNQFIEANFESDVPKTQVAASAGEICALNIDNDIICQGEYELEILDQAIGKITHLDSGEEHFCGLNTELEMYCWGKNPNGYMGTGGSTWAQWLQQ